MGLDALPKYARTSPFVSIPRTPVPLMTSGFEMLCSISKRWTEGKSGRECDGGDEWEWEGSFGGVSEIGCDFASDVSRLAGSWGAAAAGFGDSLGASRLEMSSPSSARRAMTLPTGTFFEPSGS